MSGRFVAFSDNDSVSGYARFYQGKNLSPQTSRLWTFSSEDPLSRMNSGPYRDPLWYVLFDRTLFCFGYFPTDRIMGFSDPSESDIPIETRVDGQKPVNSKYQGLLDTYRYGSGPGHPYYSDEATLQKRFAPDSEVVHQTFRGTILPSVRSSPYYVSDGTIVRCNLTLPKVKCKSPNYPYQYTLWKLNVSGTSVSHTFSTDEGRTNSFTECPMFLDDEILPIIKGGGLSYTVTGTEPPNNHWSVTYSIDDFTYQKVGDNLSMRYKLSGEVSCVSDNVFGTVVWDVEVTIIGNLTFQHVAFGTGLKPSVPITWGDLVYTWSTVSNSLTKDGIPSGTFRGGTEYFTQLGGAFFDAPVTSVGSDIDKLVSLDAPHQAVVFSQMCDRAIPDIYHTSYYSTAAAVEKFTEFLKTVSLESFADLPEILQLIPNVPLLLRGLNDLKSGRVIGGIKNLGDFIAETYLKYQFGIRPTTDTIRELNDKGSLLVSRLRSPDEFKIYYGQFDFDYPQYLLGSEFPDLHLVTRSRVEVRTDYTSMLINLVVMSRAGVIPSLSQIWETIPGSFAVDWFTNLKRRFKDLDTRMLMCALEFRTIEHSFLLTSRFPDSVLSQVDLFSSPLDPFENRYYRRILSGKIPFPVESKFDYRGPTYGPSAGIIGALLWTILS